MATAPLPTNGILNILNQGISKIAEIGDKAAVAWVKTNAPFFALPVISSLTDWAFSGLGNILSVAIQKKVDAIVLDIRQNWNNAAVVKAAQKLAQDGGSNAEDVQKLADAEGDALSFPGIGTITKF